MGRWLWVMVFVFLAVSVSASCVVPASGRLVDKSTRLCSGNYVLKGGLSVGADNFVLDCGGAVLQGDFVGAGIVVRDKKNVSITNCHLVNWVEGVVVDGSESVVLKGLHLIRNQVGVVFKNSKFGVVDESVDISLQVPVRMINSSGNLVRFENKVVSGEFCEMNSCNGGAVNSPQLSWEASVLERVVLAVINGLW